MWNKSRLVLTLQSFSFRNTIDEQKSNNGIKTAVDRDIGRHLPTSKTTTAPSLPEIGAGQAFSESVDEALKGPEGMASDKAQRIDDSVKVGSMEAEGQDLHDKAAAKQP
ncbi:hypothetical protein A1O1_00115 [Capronia coronata CBS 617.96]|uniref:Uncharacterized protein n=1 Tax=Capronia coronata CBS 617.96 TaxID=1182541 RepID=W9YQ07_9EURO|nr:uncharacterized protein A1O1_00115 [Capronia coronata CBS 617.96]EXJ94997.1 hypothetical protein A1O1_00115 [Capronia coronata CBS 617.96]